MLDLSLRCLARVLRALAVLPCFGVNTDSLFAGFTSN
jgi:hypothetical protein